MKAIKIQGRGKVNGQVVSWFTRVPVNSFVKTKANGVDFRLTQRNYFLDSKREKVRYNTMQVGQANYNKIYNVYTEVNGINLLVGTTTDMSLDEFLNRNAERIANIPKDQINEFTKNLVEV